MYIHKENIHIYQIICNLGEIDFASCILYLILNTLVTFSCIKRMIAISEAFDMRIGDVLRKCIRKTRGRLLLIRKKVRSQEQLSYPYLFPAFRACARTWPSRPIHNNPPATP